MMIIPYFYFPPSHLSMALSHLVPSKHFQNVFFEKVKCSNFTMKFSVSEFKLRFRMQNCSRTFFTDSKLIYSCNVFWG